MLYGNTSPDAELIVLQGNCQTQYLAMLLAATNPPAGGRGYVSFLNAAVPGETQHSPALRDLQRAVCYFEQYDCAESNPVRDTVRHTLPAGCPTRVFPNVRMFSFWPFYQQHDEYESAPGLPWGHYPHGDTLAGSIRAEGLTGERALAAYHQRMYAHIARSGPPLQIDIERIQQHDRASDIPFGDYLLSHYRDTKLFHSPGHLSGEAIGELACRLFLNMHALLGDGDPAAGLAAIRQAARQIEAMGDDELPIHRATAQALGLRFHQPDHRYRWFGQAWTFDEYLARYLENDCSWHAPAATAAIAPACVPPAPPDIRATDLQLRVARSLPWMPTAVTVGARDITLEGWALAGVEAPDSLRFLVNGRAFDEVHWPLPSPDMLGPFGAIPGAAAARFRCVQHLEETAKGEKGAAAGETAPRIEAGFLRFNVTSRFGEHRQNHLTAWYIGDDRRNGTPPPVASMRRSAGTECAATFLLGGATQAMRIQQLLSDRFGRPLSSFADVLEIGCGAARLTRYLSHLCPRVTAADIDAPHFDHDTAAWPNVKFHCIDDTPALPFDAPRFDLILCFGRPAYWPEPTAQAWLTELRRVLKPGGLVLLSIPGDAHALLSNTPTANLRAMHRDGIASGTHGEVLRSHDFIFANWHTGLDVLGIVESMACCQDVVILRHPAAST